MVVDSLTYLPSVVLPNKKDDEDILYPSLDMFLDSLVSLLVNSLFKSPIFPPLFWHEKAPTSVDALI